jgi:dihydrofolate reductase
MGKVISLIITTPNGSVDGQIIKTDPEYNEFWHGLLSDSQAVTFGRNSYEILQKIQTSRLENENTPEWQMRMAKALTDIPKIVYSTTLKAATWNNSTIETKIDAGNINSYKQDGEGGLLIIGSPSLIEAFTKMKLIDDYYFCVFPIIAGIGGIPFFDKMDSDTNQPLKFVESTQLKSGVHIIHYQRIN